MSNEPAFKEDEPLEKLSVDEVADIIKSYKPEAYKVHKKQKEIKNSDYYDLVDLAVFRLVGSQFGDNIDDGDLFYEWEDDDYEQLLLKLGQEKRPNEIMHEIDSILNGNANEGVINFYPKNMKEEDVKELKNKLAKLSGKLIDIEHSKRGPLEKTMALSKSQIHKITKNIE